MRGCSVDGCDRPVEAGGLCAGHRKRQLRGQVIDAPLSDSIAGRLSPASMLVEAALALADADTSDDDAYERAVDNHRKAALRYARQAVRSRVSTGLARRREAGLPLGRPPKVTPFAARVAVAAAGGSVRAAARKLGLSHASLLRALKRERDAGTPAEK